ncbi:hypothetical protein PWT90_09646 [Aphanocladium album]|nr:hypothetical protein PWT90_09646 [Aphanocladium album]
MAATDYICAANLELDELAGVPILDYDQAKSPVGRVAFVSALRQALIDIGFFYLKNPPVPKQVLDDFVDRATALCNLPLEKKLKIDMSNSKHFLGYSRAGHERTGARRDNREIFDKFLTELPPPTPEMPAYLNVQGPSQVSTA